MRQLGALPPVLSVEETCRLLGLSRSAGYRATSAGELPTIKVGRRLYVPTPALLRLLGAAEPMKQVVGGRRGGGSG
ncbi:MAG TPA: helix-turn-helix domain-containing protein [Actinomycetota bacterium]|nr:helix-turn-helix domain-containing protein [Actinomycetota bacterium]